MSKRRQQFDRWWLRRHGVHEGRLRKALTRFMRAQRAEVLQLVDDGMLEPAALIPAEWDAKLVAAAEPALRRAAIESAWSEQETVKNVWHARQTKLVAMEEAFEIPAEVMAKIKTELDTTLAQDYWAKINETTRGVIRTSLAESLDAGDGQRALIKRLRTALEGREGNATAIARTEVTGMMNSGHYHARDDLLRQGLITGSTWLSMGDVLTRASHLAAGGQTVGYGQLFSVGGHECRYPGDYSLPAEERIACRCTHVASGSWAD